MKLRLSLIILFFPVFSFSQQTSDTAKNEVRIGFQADFMRPAYPEYLHGRQVHKHEGNVIYTNKKNGATILCDSAYHYFPSDTIEFFGNIVVQHQNTILFGEKIFYDGTIAKVRGNLVRMLDQEKKAELKTQFIDYNIETNKGEYKNGGTLIRNKDTIESIDGMFDGNTGLFTLINEVALKNDSIVLSCDTMLYDTKNDITIFKKNTTVWQGENNIMQSGLGWYKPNDTKMYFSNNAYVQTNTRETWADSISFDRHTQDVSLFKNIQVIDTAKSTMIFGDKAEITDSTKAILVTMKPAALYYRTLPKGKSDTTYIVADTISALVEKEKIKDKIKGIDAKLNDYKVKTDTVNVGLVEKIPKTDMIPPEENRDTMYAKNTIKPLKIADTCIKTIDTAFRNIYAYRNVKIYNRDVQAVCDSMVYHGSDSTTVMYHLPIIWNDSLQIISGPATYYIKNKKLDMAEFTNSPIASTREDSLYFNQIKGKKMKAFFEENRIKEIQVLGNGQSVYYIREKENEPITAVEISECGNIRIEMTAVENKNAIDIITYLSKPTSNTYPLDKVPEDSDRLKGFEWRESERPKAKNEIFTRQVRKRIRNEINKIKKPEFLITKRINLLHD